MIARSTLGLLIRWLVGLLLVAAAALKLYGLAADPVGRMGIFSTPEFQVAAIEFEFLLAVWLLSGKRPLGSWVVALGTFTCFAVVSFYQGWVGQSSCGCFGSLVSVSPWYAFSLDVLMVTALLFGRPDLKPLWENPRRSLRGGLLPAAWGVAGMTLSAALAWFRGERVSIEPRLVDLGTGPRGESRDASITLSNWTDQPVQFFGGTADCACTVLQNLPVTIPAHESRSVSVRVRLTGAPGVFTRKAAFLINDEGFKGLAFRLTGQITEARTEAVRSPERVE